MRGEAGRKRAAARAKARDVSTEGANGVSDRGAQRAHRAVAAGALAVFAADLLTLIYKRATGALEVFAANLFSAIYKRAAAVFGRSTAAAIPDTPTAISVRDHL